MIVTTLTIIVNWMCRMYVLSICEVSESVSLYVGSLMEEGYDNAFSIFFVKRLFVYMCRRSVADASNLSKPTENILL